MNYFIYYGCFFVVLVVVILVWSFFVLEYIFIVFEKVFKERGGMVLIWGEDVSL